MNWVLSICAVVHFIKTKQSIDISVTKHVSSLLHNHTIVYVLNWFNLFNGVTFKVIFTNKIFFMLKEEEWSLLFVILSIELFLFIARQSMPRAIIILTRSDRGMKYKLSGVGVIENCILNIPLFSTVHLFCVPLIYSDEYDYDTIVVI